MLHITYFACICFGFKRVNSLWHTIREKFCEHARSTETKTQYGKPRMAPPESFFLADIRVNNQENLSKSKPLCEASSSKCTIAKITLIRAQHPMENPVIKNKLYIHCTANINSHDFTYSTTYWWFLITTKDVSQHQVNKKGNFDSTRVSRILIKIKYVNNLKMNCHGSSNIPSFRNKSASVLTLNISQHRCDFYLLQKM